MSELSAIKVGREYDLNYENLELAFHQNGLGKPHVDEIIVGIREKVINQTKEQRQEVLFSAVVDRSLKKIILKGDSGKKNITPNSLNRTKYIKEQFPNHTFCLYGSSIRPLSIS